MSNTFAIWNSQPAGATTPTSATSSPGSLGKQDFLNLLAAQLRNQNPLQPMDNAEFMAQTAQFHTLEQLQQMNELLSASLELNSLSQASALIGRHVTAVGDENSVVEGLVSEVTMQDGQPMLLVDGTVVAFDSIIIVGAAPADASEPEEFAGDWDTPATEPAL